MSKRWKIRMRNAAKFERSREVTAQFYGNVIAELERIKAMPVEERERLFEAARGHNQARPPGVADDEPNPYNH